MPRPQRCRQICHKPKCREFYPENNSEEQSIILSLDEYEVIRLVDLEKMTHEECALQMDISRTTVTEIYESAREKVANSIVNAKKLLIEGGNYRLCNGNNEWCHKKNCNKKSEQIIIEKGENIMRIAVTYEEGNIFQHFGHTEQLKIYDIEDNKIVNSQVIDTNGNGHAALAEFLSSNKVDILICGGIGGGAVNALTSLDIEIYAGVQGDADLAVNSLLEGKIKPNSEANCSHHEGEHNCGNNGCGHSCH